MVKRKIAFIGPSGVGKSTAAEYVSRCYDLKLVNIADPIQWVPQTPDRNKVVTDLFNLVHAYDRQLLLDSFIQRSERFPRVVNADVRSNYADDLKRLGFKLVGIYGPIRARAGEIMVSDQGGNSSSDIFPDYSVVNTGTKLELYKQLDTIMRELCG